jgi:Bacterial type II/III secretion system short domain
MNLKRFTLACIVLLMSCGLAFADAGDNGKALTVRTFQFKHKDAGAATAVVKPLLSADGSIAIQAGTNALVVTDKPENLKTIAEALAKFDTAPQMFHLHIRLVAASRESGGRVPQDMKDIGEKLSLLRFTTVESLGDTEVEGKEGDPGIVDLSGYRAEFRIGDFDSAADTLSVKDFKLSKVTGTQIAQVLKMSLNLRLNQMVILGATKVPQAQRALFLVITATR